MESPRSRCAIFCTAEIPPSTMDSFLAETEAHQLGNPELFKRQDMKTADWLVLISSMDVSSIHRGVSRPVEHFVSPFIGQSIEEIAMWFDLNITIPQTVGYMNGTFIVLDGEATESQICTIVCTSDEPVEKLRCEFALALQNAAILDMGQSMDEGSYGQL